MSELDSEIRSYIEAGIDGILNDPSSYETTIRDALKAMDVDQNHETIISVIAGLCLSATLVHSERIYGKI